MSTIAVRDPQNLVQRRPPLGRRVAPRRRLAVPVNVTVLRSGVPDAVPGRSIDVGEGGVGAVLAAELFPGELVGVEFRLPDAGSVLAKARVCYQERLRCGLQFLAIPADQREMLEAWTLESPGPIRRPVEETASRQTTPQPGRNHPIQSKLRTQPTSRTQAAARTQPTLPKVLTKAPSVPDTRMPRYLRRKIVMLLAASVIVAAGVGWWQWEESWQELESRLPGHAVEAAQAPVAVPAEVMQRLLVHKVEPISLGGKKLMGVAVLDALIGRDGSVISLRPVSGAEVLTRAAMDSVQWWKFEPYRKNGEPVEVKTTLAIEFR